MYENIMIPVSLDRDRDLQTAIAAAQKLASPGARITFFHVTESLPTYVADYIPPDVAEGRRDMVEEKLAELAASVEGSHGVVVNGASGRTITDWARDKGADLIVIASHRPQLSDIFLGSTAAWVVRHADCAVHVIR